MVQPRAFRFLRLAGAASLLALSGCRSGGVPILNLLGLSKPVVVALVAEPRPLLGQNPLELLNPFAPYEPLRQALGTELGRPVALDLCIPLQVGPNLRSGFYHVAFLSPVQYARLPGDSQPTVVAVSVDEHGRPARCALLIVAANSAIQTAEELKGKTVAFGPTPDARTHVAALNLLAEHGLARTDLSLELLPVPGSLKHMPDMRSIAQSVMNSSSDAGFIDEAAWESFAEHEDRSDEPARDRFRVITRTVALPDRLVVCSPKLEPATTERIRLFLHAADEQHPEILRPMRFAAYQEPTPELLETCRRLTGAPEVPRE